MKIWADKDKRCYFDYVKYCGMILSLIPKEDIIGISEIRFVNEFSIDFAKMDQIAYYQGGENGKKAVIEINIKNIKKIIPEHILGIHAEIAALLLSEIIGHEVGHHVRKFKRHGLPKKKSEFFAEKYGKACFYSYLRSRSKKILNSFRIGSLLFFIYDRKTRSNFIESRSRIKQWLNETEVVIFP